jgi:hypothetical protein
MVREAGFIIKTLLTLRDCSRMLHAPVSSRRERVSSWQVTLMSSRRPD